MQMNILGMRPPERPVFPDHIQYSGANRFLSPPEVDAVRAYAAKQALHPGTIGNGSAAPGIHDPTYRTVETCALVGAELNWLYERIVDRVTWANNDHYRFTLNGLGEPVGYLRYSAATDSKPAGHYDWHQDFGGGPYSVRKLSMVIQLSQPTEYRGCRLTLCTNKIWESPYLEAGDAILFPSWTPHCVTPIEAGVREALVIWISGPQFQ